MTNIIILSIGSLVYILGSFVYFRDTIRGDSKPNRVTWFLWALISFVATVLGLLEGVGWAVLPIFMSGLGPAIVFFASYKNKNAYWKLGILDWTCGVLSILSLVVWILTKDAVLAVLLIIITDALASVPTLIKTWKYPHTESGMTYLAWVINAGTAFLVAEQFNFISLAFPTYLFVMDLLLFLAVYRRKI